MTRAITAVCLGLVFLIQPIIADEPSPSKQQRFVIRVEPKITVESWAVPERSTTTSAGGSFQSPLSDSTSTETFEAALRVDGTGPAGMMIQVEARSMATQKDALKPLTGRRLNLRIDEDVENNWTVDVDNRASRAKPMTLRATSNGTGPATLVISVDGKPDELVIITTLISKD